jgi:coenzyme PQQ precursor peptide PqqA
MCRHECKPRVLDGTRLALLVSSRPMRYAAQKGPSGAPGMRRHPMAWTRPRLREICIGMEINGYFAGKM